VSPDSFSGSADSKRAADAPRKEDGDSPRPTANVKPECVKTGVHAPKSGASFTRRERSGAKTPIVFHT